MSKEEVAVRLTELYAKCIFINTPKETKFTDIYNIMLENINDVKDKKLQERIDKAIELLGKYKHYCVPDEIRNRENEELVEKAYEILKGEENDNNI